MLNQKFSQTNYTSHDMIALQDYMGVGELVAEFTSYQSWLNGTLPLSVSLMQDGLRLIYLDSDGLFCTNDADFKHARYPVKVFQPVSVHRIKDGC